MKLQDAFEVKERIQKDLIGLPFDDDLKDWLIRDIVIARPSLLKEIYMEMWDRSISNEMAIPSESRLRDDFEVFIVSHQWNYGSGDLLHRIFVPESGSH
jgi:hypothetical protein